MTHRSKRYQAVKEGINKGQPYSVEEAIKLVKTHGSPKFDAGMELHLRLGTDPKRAEQVVRGTVQLPHGTGKVLKVAAFVPPEQVDAVKKAGADIVGGAELIAQIKADNKTPFDVAVAHPSMMKSLAPIAKTLGQKGLMPNPRNETVSAKVIETVQAIKKGKATFRTDDSGNLHFLIGRVSFADAQLTANLETIIEAVRRQKPAEFKGTFISRATLCATMGPAVLIAV